MGGQATFISAYAPTLTSNDLDKDEFYEDLKLTLTNVHKDDKLILLGNFNARLRIDCLE